MTTENVEQYDVIIIGGGVNGTGIAADAASRGLSVYLCEQNDLASATSSNSSKLIHGGLRYLEHYEFKLVQQALKEREVLLKNAPHIMHPLRFILPHQKHLRPAWMIRSGLFLYDNLSKRKTLSRSQAVRFTEYSPLVSSIKKGFEYSDGWVDDARLVVLNAMLAKEHNAVIENYTKCTHAQREDEGWRVEVTNTRDIDTSGTRTIQGKALINAAGPWVSSLFDNIDNLKAPQQIRLVKGSHIVVPRIHDQSDAYILQNADGRIVFVLPYETDFSLVGTTDVEHTGKPETVAIDDQEIEYLLQTSNDYFKHKIRREDIVHSYSGVRPLLDDESVDAQKVTRDYTIEINWDNDKAPLLSVFGGKITTYRKLSEKLVDELAPRFPTMNPCQTSTLPLPGGDFGERETLSKSIATLYPYLPHSLIARYVRSYGTKTLALLGDVCSLEGMGTTFGADLYQREVDYLIDNEWAKTDSDILWRRSKLGLRLSGSQQDTLKAYLATKVHSE
ncbi:glycerol-3-phosphate dehydrogenase [Thalassotalea euphylliae]|uniref:glycerol-3-phosphate dehydrogenase n=1 Tax=Thalassotalea euphylliae TaxID=1655234 RepID=UPI003625BC20